MYNIVNLAFQSTLPARGATIPANGNRENLFHFNPRSPHGERRPLPRCAVPSMRISIHAPRTGSDGSLTIQTARPDAISIHAPRTGSDACRCRANCGAYKFQSTLPARGATRQHGVPKSSLSISIHAPRTGSDRRHQAHHQAPRRFQSTLPARGATAVVVLIDNGLSVFQSTLPARGATCFHVYCDTLFHVISIHAPRTGSDIANFLQPFQVFRISIHAPRTGSDVSFWNKYR